MNGWTDNKYPVEDDIDQDYQREIASIGRMEFEDAMLKHVQANGNKECGNRKCIFCLTYGELMVVDRDATDYPLSGLIETVNIVDWDNLPF